MDERSATNQDHERGFALEALRAALIAGEKSGDPRAVDPATFLKRMRIAHKGNRDRRSV